MTLITMSDAELNRLDTIKRLHEKKLTRTQAADLIGVSVRQAQRILNRYRAEGVSGLVSKKRGQPSNRRYPASFREYAIHLVRTQYADFGPTLAREKLSELNEISVSVTTLRKWMLTEGIWVSRRDRSQRIGVYAVMKNGRVRVV